MYHVYCFCSFVEIICIPYFIRQYFHQKSVPNYCIHVYINYKELQSTLQEIICARFPTLCQ